MEGLSILRFAILMAATVSQQTKNNPSVLHGYQTSLTNLAHIIFLLLVIDTVLEASSTQPHAGLTIETVLHVTKLCVIRATSVSHCTILPTTSS